MENPSGLVPYFHAYAGKGYEHAPLAGIESPAPLSNASSYGPKPEDMAIGLLDRVHDSLTAADELNSARIARVLRNTYLRMYAAGDTAALSEQMANAGLGAVIDTSMVSGIDWEKPSPPEPDLAGLTAAVMTDIDQGTFSGVVAGERQAGVETATEFSLMLGAARISFGVPMQAINRMAALVLEMGAELAVENDATITLNGVAVKASEFEAGFDVEVDFLHKDEGELQRERQIGMEEITRGLRSKRRYFEATGVADATSETDEITVDTALQNDLVQQTIIQAAAAEFQARVAKSKGGTASPSVPGAGVSGVQAPPTPQPQAPLPSYAGQTEPAGVPPDLGRLVP